MLSIDIFDISRHPSRPNAAETCEVLLHVSVPVTELDAQEKESQATREVLPFISRGKATPRLKRDSTTAAWP